MLIRYFKPSYLGQYIALLIITLILWGPSFFNPQQITLYEGTSPLWNLIAGLLIQIPLLGVIVSFLLAFFSALLLNTLLANHGLIKRNSLLAAMMYVLLIGSSFHFHQLNPIVLVNFLIILQLFNLFQLYDLKEAYRVAFSVGFLNSMAFLVYPPSVFFFIPVYLVFMTMGNLTWREWLIPLIAFTLPIIYVAVYYFWIDESSQLIHALYTNISSFRIFYFRFDLLNWIKIAIIFPVLLVTFFKVMSVLSAKNIDVRKKTFALMHFFVFGSLIFLFLVFPYRQFSLLFVPVAAFMAMWFSETTRTLKYNLALILLFILSVIDNYQILKLF